MFDICDPIKLFFFRKMVYVLMSRHGKKNGNVEFLYVQAFVNFIGRRPFKEENKNLKKIGGLRLYI